MASETLLEKLDPDRYPNMSMSFIAILGFLLNENWTTPVILEITIIDDIMLAMSEGQYFPNLLGNIVDLRANLRHLGMASGLTTDEWVEYRRLVENRLQMTL